MKKIITVLVGFLFLSLNLFGVNGRVAVDITYDKINGGGNNSLRLMAYYTKQAIAYDNCVSRLNSIIFTQRLNGAKISNIVSSPIIDVNGKIETEITYDDNAGRSNNKYTITEYYDPRAEANNSVIEQIQNIKSSLKIYGSDISNVKASNIMEVPGGYSATITYNDKNGSSMKYIIDEFYDPKLKARDFIEDRVLDLDLESKMNKNISNVKADDVQEIPGGYTTTISYQDSKNFTQKYTVNEFYDPKAKALFDIKNQITSITNKSIINGNQISDLKVGKIQDIDGKYSVILNYIEKTGGRTLNLTLNYFYDPKSKAIFDLNNQIISIRNQSIVNGDKITNLKIGKVLVL